MKRRGGDERAGFEVEVDRGRKILFLRVWGFWQDAALLRSSSAAVGEACSALHATRSPWYLFVDASRSAPQTAEVQAEIASNMRKAMELGVTRVATVLDSTVTKLQLRRLGTASGFPPGLNMFFNNESEALR